MSEWFSYDCFRKLDAQKALVGVSALIANKLRPILIGLRTHVHFGLRDKLAGKRVGNFSTAAKTLNVTQSSVSQQIAKLEDRVGGRLFNRVGHQIAPTALAQSLNQLAVNLLEQVREFQETQQKIKQLPEGIVRYAMPESCQWTPHFKWVMSALSRYPGIRIEVGICPNEQVIEKLMDGTLDFGFLVAVKPRPEFQYEKFSNEAYSAVANHREHFEPFVSKKPAPLRLIRYPGADLYTSVWAKGTGLWSKMKDAYHHPILEVGTLAGAINAVKSGTGIAIVPTHCVADELRSGALVEVKPPQEGRPSKPIYFVKRHRERFPHRVEVVIELLKKSKLEGVEK